jgi:5-(carboxyamino)imidazole ribonucleotide synthase
MTEPIKIGILGGGQLARMFAQAANKLGYLVHVFTPEKNSPAKAFCAREFIGNYDNFELLEQFARSVAVVTLEFENIPCKTLDFLAQYTAVKPKSEILYISQNRIREKTSLRNMGFAVADFYSVVDFNSAMETLKAFDYQAIIKTAELGYDGKGQLVVSSEQDLKNALKEFGSTELIIERKIKLDTEISVVVARKANQENIPEAIEVMGPFENEHEKGILFISTYPANISEDIKTEAINVAKSLAQQLEYEGVLCIEFFISESGDLLINELAPRPHNSAHLTIDAFECSQFEQQVRAVLGLPLGSNKTYSSAVMVNLLGDLWKNSSLAPDWQLLNKYEGLKLHLYGKSEARAGRKMGHFTVLNNDPLEAKKIALAAFAELL